MKITILTPLYWPSLGGVQTSARLIGAYLAKQGHEITVLTSQMRTGDEGSIHHFRRIRNFPASETHERVSIRRFPTGGHIDRLYAFVYRVAHRLKLPFWPWLHDVYRLRRFRASSMLRHLRSHPPDLVLIAPFTDELIKLGLKIKRLTGAKVATQTSLHISFLGFAPKQLPLLKQYDAILANTAFERDFLLKAGVPPEKVHAIGVPVDMGSMNAVTPVMADRKLIGLSQKKYVLYLARKEKGKGASTLVDIFNEPSEELRDVTLVLAGETTDYFEKEIRPRIQNNRSIVVAKTLDEAAKWWLMKHATAYCMVSSVDSFGIVYLEAWLSGIPVVAADLPAMRCVVNDGENGLLAPYGDKERIRKALSRLVSDPDAARRMGEKGRQKTLLEHGDCAVEKKAEQILMALF